MAVYKLKRKLFTKWDETDRLKQMTDSDILAEKKRKQNIGSNAMNTSLAVGTSALAGAGIGAGLGIGGGILSNAHHFNTRGLGFVGGASSIKNGLAGAGRTAMKWGKYGAIAGAGLGLYNSVKKQNKQANDNKFYNDRLDYAQRQAKRRERKDWKQNMTQREGYTY